MEDSTIIALYFARDEQAVTETAEKYGKYCLTIAQNILSDRLDSEECVNDTWLQTWHSIPPQKPNCLRAWLSSITRNLAINRYNTRHRAKRAEESYTLALEELSQCIASPEDTESVYLRQSLAESLNRFLETLPDRERDIFLGRYYFLYTTAEVARRLGMKENYVRNILSRTRVKLKKHLEKEAFDL